MGTAKSPPGTLFFVLGGPHCFHIWVRQISAGVFSQDVAKPPEAKLVALPIIAAAKGRREEHHLLPTSIPQKAVLEQVWRMI